MHGRYSYRQADTIWGGLGEIATVVHLNSTQEGHVAPLFHQADGALSWTDAAVVAHCIREDAEPLCFDEDIEQAFREQAG